MVKYKFPVADDDPAVQEARTNLARASAELRAANHALNNLPPVPNRRAAVAAAVRESGDWGRLDEDPEGPTRERQVQRLFDKLYACQQLVSDFENDLAKARQAFAARERPKFVKQHRELQDKAAADLLKAAESYAALLDFEEAAVEAFGGLSPHMDACRLRPTIGRPDDEYSPVNLFLKEIRESRKAR